MTAPDGESTTVGYDGLARLTYVKPSGTCGTPVPTHRFEYELAPGGQPVSVVYSHEEPSCTAIGSSLQLRSRSYVDGLGCACATALRAEGTDRWVQFGVGTFTARGTASKAYQQVFLSAADPSIAEAVAIPSSPNTKARYDAFGRVVVSIAEDDAQYVTVHRALSTEAWDPLDLGSDDTFEDTPAISRTDGHGRVIDQVLINRQPGSSTDEYHRLFTAYRADGAVVEITRAETGSADHDAAVVSGRTISRTFVYDTAGRRIASTDPDTDSTDGGKTAANRTWRYLFNTVGDLVAVRDPRGCGQNFYYDRAGRLVAEAYVECAEAQVSGDEPDEEVPVGSVALDVVESSVDADVRHYFDGEVPSWSGFPSRPSSWDEGRLTATSDRGQRTQFAYDKRGNLAWQGRQVAFLDDAAAISSSLTDPPTVDDDDAPTRATRVFDEANTYVMEQTYDHGGRPVWTTYPTDPDWDDMGGSNPGPPVVRGRADYNPRGLVHQTRVEVDGTDYWVHKSVTFNASRLPTEVELGDDQGGARDETVQSFEYDERLRLTRTHVLRDDTGGMAPDLSAVTVPLDQTYTWDGADNLIQVDDGRLKEEWDDGYRPQRAMIGHDALYRVADVLYDYKQSDGTWASTDTGTDWRDQRTFHRNADPMREDSAAMLPDPPDDRVVSLIYEHDWLANMTAWTADDGAAFYERSIGRNDATHAGITNGFEEGKRPSALYLATNLPTSSPGGSTSTDRGGFVELDYGEGGNVVAMTVRARCVDSGGGANRCWDDTSLSLDQRIDKLRTKCVCAAEQHYQYRWDELNRIAEARRYDRAGTGDWSLAVRQRYRYDGANVRTHKETFDDGTTDRTVLYAYPGAYERSGVERDLSSSSYLTHTTNNTESQYLVGGARLVWKHDPGDPISYDLGADLRITYALADLLGSTSAVVDLWSGELLEVATWYPNGAQETLLNQTSAAIQPEAAGFTGKEADDEVGVVYFGERYLIPRIGRWASPDPLHVHAVGGGEALNSYHYVSGNLLQARDALGLDVQFFDASGERDESGAVTSFDATPHRSGTPATPGQGQQANRQAREREQLVAGLRTGFSTMYDNLIAAADDAGASSDEIDRLRQEQSLVVASIGDPELRDGRWHLTLDTTRIDSELGGRTHWAYSRLREAVESDDVVGLAVDNEADPFVLPGESGVTVGIPAARSRGRPIAVSIIGTSAMLRGSNEIGRNVIHELDLHTVPRVRGEPWFERRHMDRARTGLDARGTADLGDDYLRRFIPTSGEAPFRRPPAWDWNPDSRGAVQVVNDMIAP